jgi:Tol biopolymer transport system component
MVSLTEVTGHDYEPFGSADGRWIAFTDFGSDGHAEIYKVTPTGTALARVTRSDDSSVSPSFADASAQELSTTSGISRVVLLWYVS